MTTTAHKRSTEIKTQTHELSCVCTTRSPRDHLTTAASVHETAAMGGSGPPMDTMDGTGAGITTGADGTLVTTGAEDAGARLTRVFILPAAAFINAATMPSGLSGFAGDSAVCAAAGAAPTLALNLRGLIPFATAGAAAALGAAATGSGSLGTG